MKAIETIKRELRAALAPFGAVPVTIFVIAALMLCVQHYWGQGKFFRRVVGPAFFDPRDIGYFSCLYWPSTALICFLVIPLLSLRVLARVDPSAAPLQTAGLGLGDWRFGLKAAGLFYAVMVPLLFWVIWMSGFQGKYPLCDDAPATLTRFVIYEAGFAIYFIAWEYLWRGYLLFGLEKTFGPWTNFVQMLPFVVVHFPKPELEAISSIAGGLALGWLALRTRSIWYGWFVHAATAITLECLVVAVEGGIGR